MLELLLTRPAVAAPAVVVVGYVLYHVFLKAPKLPWHLPIIGAKEEDWFPKIQARWRNTVDFKNSLKQGYEKYRDQTVIVPASHRTVVMLPLSEADWYMSQPDDVLSFHDAAHEALQLDHTSLDRRLAHDTANNRVVAVTLNAQLAKLMPGMLEEVAVGFEKHWAHGNDQSPSISCDSKSNSKSNSSGREVHLYETMSQIIAGVTARVILGPQFSRDDDFLRLSTACAQDVIISAHLLLMAWKPLRPLLAPLVTLPANLRLRRYKHAIAPEVNRRLAAWDARARDHDRTSTSTSNSEPNDFLQWTIRNAKERGDPSLWELNMLAGRTLMFNFAAIHTSSITQTAAVLEVAASDASVVAELRAEIAAVVAEHGWTKRSLARMEKLDSVFRESARLNSFVTLGVERRVVARGGIVTPSGVAVPQGGVVCLPAYGVLNDEAFYPDSESFRSFRFSDARAVDAGASAGVSVDSGAGAGAGAGAGGDSPASYVQRARNAFPTTKPEFLVFGHGRHACPGRFFAALELKLMMAYIILNYDIEPRKKTPDVWLGINRVPDMSARIRIKRREKS